MPQPFSPAVVTEWWVNVFRNGAGLPWSSRILNAEDSHLAMPREEREGRVEPLFRELAAFTGRALAASRRATRATALRLPR